MGDRASAATRLAAVLPRGVPLPEATWQRRHRQICRLLWAHVALAPVLTTALGLPLAHGLAEAFVPGALAVVAGNPRLGRTVRAGASTLGLLACSAILIHASGGLIESHFHFFVIVVVVSLYQSWEAFGLALAFVVLHHGLLGTLAPEVVFNHDAGLTAPWKWALLHGGFILAESLVCLIAWRINEDALQGERWARSGLELANRDLATAQELSGIGSWQLDLESGKAIWSAQMHAMLGVPSGTEVTITTFLQRLHPDDHDHAVAAVAGARRHGDRIRFDCTVITADGARRVVTCLGQVSVTEDGHRHMHGTLQDITARMAIQQQAAHDALHDPLTGLGNRTLFHDRAAEALDHHRRSGAPLCVLYLDLDDFKTVNDSMGHGVGDELLVDIAVRLQAAVRPGDTLARLGGDEFGVLLAHTTVTAAERIAGDLEAAMVHPLVLQGLSWTTRASIGIAGARPGLTVRDLLRNADLAMYAAKRSGKGGHRVFDEVMLTSARSRMSLKAELKSALEADQYLLHFQPLVHLGSGEVTGVEALVRWAHPQRGLVSPLEFIPLAEETGLIVPLGAWVLQQATAAVHRLEQDLGLALTLTVNVSAAQLTADLPMTVRQALRASGLPPGHLVLEITESTMVAPEAQVLSALMALRETGVRIAIDDFGTGYSSLSALRGLPIDILKIDRSFVEGVTDGGVEASALARAIVQLGQLFGLQTIAEGIETAEQADLLREYGCDLAQGYLYSRPLPLADLRSSLQERLGSLAITS